MPASRRALAVLVGLACSWPTAAPARGGGPLAQAAEVPSPEAADEASSAPRIGLLPVVIAADAAPEVGDADDRLTAKVRGAFADSSLDLVALDAERTGDAASPFCADAVCWQAMAAQLGVTHFLVVVVTFDEPDYRVSMWLVEGASGARTSEVAEPCDLCGISELGAHVGDMAATMRRELEAAQVEAPRLVVTSVPSGAEVELDGEVIGQTPLTVESVPGSHSITLRREGYAIDRRRLDLVGGVERIVDVQLRSLGAGDDQGERDHQAPPGRGLIITGVASAVAGTASLGGGAAMVLLHDQPIESDCDGVNVDALGRCRYLHDTRRGGIALLVTGGVLVATGVTLLALGLRARGRQGRVRPTASGVALRF